MAKENTINLPDKIKLQNKNDLIIFTTYTFDPIFFDAYMLKKLKKHNEDATIIVLMDAKLYSKLDKKKDFTDQTGRAYALIPISGNLFHPKIFMFGSKLKKQTFLGSHNLTLSGLAVNLELCFSSNDTDLFGECIDYVYSLLEKKINPKHPVLKKIEPYVNRQTKNQRLLTNENEAILEQCLGLVSKQLNSIEEVIIFSPFFSETKKLIEKIMTLNPNEIKLCVQKNNHDLDPATVISFDRLSLNEVCKDNRTLHSKFIVFRSPGKDLILIGSPNFTRPALLETNDDGGNFESAILWELNSDDFIKNYLKIEPISPNEVKTSQREFNKSTGSQSKPDIMITFAYFDGSGYLYVDYKSETKKSLTLEFYDADQLKISTEPIELEKGVHSIRISPTLTKIYGICFTEKNKPVSNFIPVCDSEKVFRIRTVINLKDPKAIEDLCNNNNNLEDLPNILYSIYEAISDDSDEQISSTDRKNNSEIVPWAGVRRTKTKSKFSSYDSIKKRFKISVKTQTGSTSGQKYSGKTNPKHLEKNEFIKKTMEKLKDDFNYLIITYPEEPKLYYLFLRCELVCLRSIESKNNDQGLLSATIIQYLNEIIKEDEFFSKRNIDKIKIWAILVTLTKLYHKNLKRRYEFDNAEILCAFKSIFDRKKDSEIYFVMAGMFEKLEKIPKFKNKIDNQAEFPVDDERIDKEISHYENKLGLD